MLYKCWMCLVFQIIKSLRKIKLGGSWLNIILLTKWNPYSCKLKMLWQNIKEKHKGIVIGDVATNFINRIIHKNFLDFSMVLTSISSIQVGQTKVWQWREATLWKWGGRGSHCKFSKWNWPWSWIEFFLLFIFFFAKSSTCQLHHVI